MGYERIFLNPYLPVTSQYQAMDNFEVISVNIMSFLV